MLSPPFAIVTAATAKLLPSAPVLERRCEFSSLFSFPRHSSDSFLAPIAIGMRPSRPTYAGGIMREISAAIALTAQIALMPAYWPITTSRTRKFLSAKNPTRTNASSIFVDAKTTIASPLRLRADSICFGDYHSDHAKGCLRWRLLGFAEGWRPDSRAASPILIPDIEKSLLT